jgi:hypothetical protein
MEGNQKKEAQIKIQAVAKIQYPIKSLNTNANHSPFGLKQALGRDRGGN